MTFQWSEPEEISGTLIGYRINYSGSRENRTMHVLEETILLPENTTQYQVRNLMPLYSYIFEVRRCFSNINIHSKKLFMIF